MSLLDVVYFEEHEKRTHERKNEEYKVELSNLLPRSIQALELG